MYITTVEFDVLFAIKNVHHVKYFDIQEVEYHCYWISVMYILCYLYSQGWKMKFGQNTYYNLIKAQIKDQSNLS